MTTRVSYASYTNAARDALQMTADEGVVYAVVENYEDDSIWVMRLVEAVAFAEEHVAEYIVPPVEEAGDGDPNFPGGIGCEHCSSLWATAEGAREHHFRVHPEHPYPEEVTS